MWCIFIAGELHGWPQKVNDTRQKTLVCVQMNIARATWSVTPVKTKSTSEVDLSLKQELSKGWQGIKVVGEQDVSLVVELFS